MSKIKKGQEYRNITTGEAVEVLDISFNKEYDLEVVDYFNQSKEECFLKYAYVFLKTYKLILN